jgi:tetratricopeptide (TPR) repeat protein
LWESTHTDRVIKAGGRGRRERQVYGILKREEAIMNIAEYITSIRYAFYPSRKNEVKPTTREGDYADGLREILIGSDTGMMKGEIREAMKKHKEAITINPDDSDAHFRLSISYILLNDRRSALEEYKILKKLSPRTADELLQKWNVKTPWSYR